jgi:ABC-type bacteriocin/lantibiotic exporter with double-glycine peptidase domain
VQASLIESSAKYTLYEEIEHNFWTRNKTLAGDYLAKRDVKFGYIRRQSITVHCTYVALQVLQLAWGIYLVQANQLALGNLVSAEIILSGILYSYVMVPKMIDGFYKFETGCIKIDSIKEKPSEDAMVLHES